MTPFEFRRAASLDQAVTVSEQYGSDACYLAGGATLVPILRSGTVQPRVVIQLGGIAELSGIRAAEAPGLELAALTTIRQLEVDVRVRDQAPGLAMAASRVASVRIRNQATLGGNLVHADPAFDLMPALLVHDAWARVYGPSGERQMPIDQVALGPFETAIRPGEVLTSIRVPKPSRWSQFDYVKATPRTPQDRSSASVAVRVDRRESLQIDDVRVAYASQDCAPRRIPEAEAALRGLLAGMDEIEEAARALSMAIRPMESSGQSASYQREVARVSLMRSLRGILRVASP